MKDHQLLLKLPPIQFKVDIVGSDQLSELQRLEIP